MSESRTRTDECASPLSIGSTVSLDPVASSLALMLPCRDDSIDEPVEEFPPGFRMMAGSASRNTFNASSYADQAVSFVCLGVSGPQTNSTSLPLLAFLKLKLTF